jgi:hypothetical protein
MSETIDDFKEFSTRNTVIQDVIIESDSGLGFDLGAEIIAALTVTFILQSYFGAIIGKLGEETWRVIKRITAQLDSNNKKNSRSLNDSIVCVIYEADLGSSHSEILIAYSNVRDLKRDLKNHRQYLAFALGFASGKTSSANYEISLLSSFSPLPDSHLRGFKLRTTDRH